MIFSRILILTILLKFLKFSAVLALMSLMCDYVLFVVLSMLILISSRMEEGVFLVPLKLFLTF